MTLGAVTSTPASLATPLPIAGFREEICATLLKPYLLRLERTHGEEMVRALLVTSGLPEGLLDESDAWISIAAALRGLAALEHILGEGSLENHGEWMTHPENLGSYVRMLRAVSRPLDAYRYFCAHADDNTRVGSYEIEVRGPASVAVTYLSDEDDDSPQDDRLFCLARKGNLRALPRLWGLDDAHVGEASCIANGDEACVYEVRWEEAGRTRLLPVFATATALSSGALVSLVTNLPLGLATTLFGGALGVGLLRMQERTRKRRRARIFAKHRIAALEQGLRLHDASAPHPGDLSGLVVGGKYRMLRQIGQGGAGAVYAAEHIALSYQVAVKVLRGGAARDASEIARLRREAQVQVSIEHPNVVRTFDLDKMSDGSLYVVMELLRGESLSAKLAREGLLAPPVAVPVFLQACRALAVTHERDIVHRDIKPANLFVCDDGTAKILDFGMSKLATAESLTRGGYALGTPEYMAPEQCLGALVEPRTDIYSLGVLMYEALTGELPIVASSRRELLELHPSVEPLSMRALRPDLAIPEALDEAVMMALRKRPEERPTAMELERMLRAL